MAAPSTRPDNIRQMRPRRGVLRSLISDWVSRSQFASRTNLSYETSATTATGYDRDMTTALGYKSKLAPEDYWARYQRGGIAERIVEAYPRATWAGGASIVEDPDPKVETEFEVAVEELFDRLDVWARLLRADILAGLGRFSVILIGAEGEMSAELPNLRGPDSILYLTPLSERRVSINSFVEDPTDERFSLPEVYKVQLGTKRTSRMIHWSRIIHVAENTLEDDIYGKPRLRGVWNYLDDLAKVVGGGSEAAWQRMNPGMQLDLDPEVELDADAEQALSDEIDEYLHKMRRVIRTRGVDLNILSANVHNFGSNTDSVLQLISATTGIPHRILTGSERGELASTQDRNNWNDRNDERRREFAIPVTSQLLDRFIDRGALPDPKDPYSIVWPDVQELDEKDKADVTDKLAKANKSQAESEGKVIITSDEIRESILGLEPLGEVVDEGDEIEPVPEDDETDDQAMVMRAAADLADRDATEPEWKSIHRVADRHRDVLMGLFLTSWASAASGINTVELERALEANNRVTATAVVLNAIEAADDELAQVLPDSLHEVLGDAGQSALRSVRGRGSWFRSSQSLRSAQIEMSFNTNNPRAVAWAAARSSQLITEVGIETKEAVRAIISRGILEGIPPRKMINLIKERVGLRTDQILALERFAARAGVTQKQIARYRRKLHRDRGLLIARTETLRSANQGQRELWLQARDQRQLPADQKRVWIATPDSRTRDAHAAMNGQVRGLEESFQRPDGALIEPGQEPNCRCAQGIATPEDIKRAGETSGPPVDPSVGPLSPEGTWGEFSSLRGNLRGDWQNTFESRGQLKAQISKDLTQRMSKANPELFGNLPPTLSEKAVSTLVDQWAHSSGDGNVRSIALQLAAQEEFALQRSFFGHISDDVIAEAWHMLNSPANASRGVLPGGAFEGIKTGGATGRDVVRAFLRAQHEATQAWFAEQGIVEITLARGSIYSKPVEIGFSQLRLQPLSSFTADLDVATSFGRNVHFVRVPVQQVLSTYRTGVGCLSESEVVVMGMPELRAWNINIFTLSPEGTVSEIAEALGGSLDSVRDALYETLVF